MLTPAMLERAYDRAVAALLQAEKVCIVTHLRPDADAVGSATALSHALRQLGKETRMVIGQLREVPTNLRSIPGAEEIETTRDLPQGYDLYVAVDCGALDRTGMLDRQLEGRADFVCIDHHASNQGFADINVIDVECESTTMVLKHLFTMLGVELNRDIAHCLYAGLVTDTGSFRWGRPVMHDMASELMSYGLDVRQIAIDLIDSVSAPDLYMVGRVLSGLRLVNAGKRRLAVLVASRDLTGDSSESAVESLVEFIRALEGTDMGVVFKELAPSHWAVSLRSTTINCAEVAVRMSGGGHVPAAGYTTQGSVRQIIDELVEAVRLT